MSRLDRIWRAWWIFRARRRVQAALRSSQGTTLPPDTEEYVRELRRSLTLSADPGFPSRPYDTTTGKYA